MSLSDSFIQTKARSLGVKLAVVCGLALFIFGLLYGLIYVLLRLEDNALWTGAITSFLAVAAAMYFTRAMDWHSSLPATGSSEPPAMPLSPKGAI